MSDRLPRMSDTPRRPVLSEHGSNFYDSQHQRDHTPRPRKLHHAPSAEPWKKTAAEVLGFGSICAFEVISHPFIVGRRSCQIFYPAQRLHLTPFTLVPVMVNLHLNKPAVSMYKGFLSSLLCRGLNKICEGQINEFTNLPIQVSSYSTINKHCLHLVLKSMGYIILSPFYVSCFVESVQSYGCNDTPTVYEFLIDGFNRLVGRGHTAWIVPMWQLVLPTVTFKLSQYCIQSMARYAVMRAKSERQQESSDNSSPVDGTLVSLYDQQFPGLLATFTGTFIADLVLYPFETVLHRLYIQGTRVLIDDMDTGLAVAVIQTKYTGVIDCFRSILIEEGIWGFYQGFGAFVLQFMLHAVGLKVVQYLFDTISHEPGRKRHFGDWGSSSRDSQSSQQSSLDEAEVSASPRRKVVSDRRTYQL